MSGCGQHSATWPACRSEWISEDLSPIDRRYQEVQAAPGRMQLLANHLHRIRRGHSYGRGGG